MAANASPRTRQTSSPHSGMHSRIHLAQFAQRTLGHGTTSEHESAGTTQSSKVSSTSSKSCRYAHDPILMLNHIHVFPTGRIRSCMTSYETTQTSTNPHRQQNRCVDHPIPITYILTHYMARHRQPPPSRFLCVFIDCSYPSPYPSPSISPLSAEEGDGKLSSYVKRVRDVKGHIPHQRNVSPNKYSSSRMAIFSSGMTNTHGWWVNRSNSRYVAFPPARLSQPGPLAETIVVGCEQVVFRFIYFKNQVRRRR